MGKIDFDQLPYLIRLKINSYLSVKDKVRIRLVSKKFSSLFKEFKQDILCLSECNHLTPDIKWPSSNQKLTNQDTIEIKRIHRLIHVDLTNDFFKNIKKLFLNEISNLRSLLKTIDHLTKLEILIIKNGKIENGQCKIEIISQSLKQLYLDNICSASISVKAERLELLSNLTSLNVKLEYPHTLKFILASTFFYSDNELNRFINLKELTYVNHGVELNLINFPKLTLINVFFACTDAQNMRKIYDNLLKQKIALDRQDLKILISGFECFVDLKICRLLTFDDDYAEQLSINYSKMIESVHFPLEFDFDSFANYFKAIPNDFFSKFIRFDYLKVGSNQNESILIEFLSEIEYVRTLTFDKCEKLNQIVLDRLLICSISFLNLENNSINLREDLNFNFLKKMKFLRGLTLKALSFSPEVIYELFAKNNLEYFIIWNFNGQSRESRFGIYKIDENMFELSKCKANDNWNYQRFDLSELLGFLEKINFDNFI